MIEKPGPTPRSNRAQVQDRLRVFWSSRRSKMFGFVEVVALAGSGLILFLVLFSYLYFLVPARSRLAMLQAERAGLQVSLRKASEIVHQGRDTKTTVDSITHSMDIFENKELVSAQQGRTSLYDDLNQLIIKNSLRNTSGPTYTSLEPSGSTSTGKSANTKWQSVYPGIGVAVTVEGQYQTLRHFIRDIENARQLIIINQVELQRATETNTPAAEGVANAGSRGSLVSLQLNMATYFQRNNAQNGGAAVDPN